jgi:hypothetical protein
MSDTTWSDGKIPITVSGSVFSSRNAVNPHAGAVFRAHGSLRMWSAAIVGICSAIVLSNQWLVTTHTSLAEATGSNRTNVC